MIPIFHLLLKQQKQHQEEKMHFPKIDDFFSTQEERDAEKLEKVEKRKINKNQK